MSAALVADLRREIGEGRAVVIAGAGVPIAASGGDPCANWIGLLWDALSWCQDRVPGHPAQWPGVAQSLLDAGDVDSLLMAAEMLTTWLGGRGGGDYRGWLHERVGSLPLVDRAVPQALADLGVPVATTNYDDLIEQTAGWRWATWRDSARVVRALRAGDPRALGANERTVLHLHGHWEEPESVVLGIRSYEEVLGDGPAQALERAMGALRSVVLVGVGAGARDPNLGALWRWLARTFPGVEHRHYRLCLESEVQELRAEHPPEERIAPVPYGSRHQDLAGFLRGLARSAPAPTVTSGGRSAALPPAPMNTFGRDVQVAEAVANLLGPPPAPTVVLGAAGIGKTNLTLAVLHAPEVAAAYGHRRYFVRCEGATSATAVVSELAGALGVPLVGGDLRAACLAQLGAGPAVVCLDNAETPWEADALACEELFGQLAEVAGLLVSLRGGERPGGARWAPLRLEPLGAADARTLFLSVAPPGFNGSGLEELLAEMDGVPLAVELLAHAAEGEASLQDLARRWRAERVRLLARGSADHRLLSVAVSLEASWQGRLMTPQARRLLSLMGRLPDGVAHGDLGALLPGAGSSAAAVLRRRGLAFDEAGRLRTFSPVRHHVATGHPPEPDDWARAAAHYRQLVADLGLKVGRPGGADAARRLAAEVADVRAALEAELGGEAPQSAIDALLGAAQFARFTGADLTPTLLNGLEAARRVRDDVRLAHVLRCLGDIALARSDHDGARACYEEAQPLYHQVGDVLGEANCITSLGDIALERSDHDGARARYEEAQPLYHQVGDVLGEANCILRLGDIALERSDHEGARARYEEAQPLYHQVGDVLGEANCIWRLGDIALRRSDHERARARYGEALSLYRHVGSVQGEANCIWRLGDIALRRSDHEGARARYEEALCMYERIPEPYSIGHANRRLARLMSDPQERQRHLDAARRAWVSIDRADLVADLDDELPTDGSRSP